MKKPEIHAKFLENKKTSKPIKEAVLHKISETPDIKLQQFQSAFKITNKETADMLGLSIKQIENIRTGRSKQTKQSSILLKLLTREIKRELKKQISEQRKPARKTKSPLEEFTETAF